MLQASPCSLEKARDKVRTTVNSNMTGDIVVNLMDGTYALSETFKLEENATTHDSRHQRFRRDLQEDQVDAKESTAPSRSSRADERTMKLLGVRTLRRARTRPRHHARTARTATVRQGAHESRRMA